MPSETNSNPYSKSYKKRSRQKRKLSPPPKKISTKTSKKSSTSIVSPPKNNESANNTSISIATATTHSKRSPVKKDGTSLASLDSRGIGTLLQASFDIDSAHSDVRTELDFLSQAADMFEPQSNNANPSSDPAPNTYDFNSPDSFQGLRDDYSGDMNLPAEQDFFNRYCDDKEHAATTAASSKDTVANPYAKKQVANPYAKLSSDRAAGSVPNNNHDWPIDKEHSDVIDLLMVGVDYDDTWTPPPKKANVPLKTPEDYDTDDEVEETMKKFLEQDTKSGDGLKFAEATVHSDTHEARRQHVFTSFLRSINRYPHIYGDMSDYVRDNSGRLVPKLIIKLGGTHPSMAHIRLASMALWYFAKDLKKLRTKEGECPFLEPSSHNTYMKTLLGYLKEQYNWNYSIQHDFNFQGGYTPRINLLFSERMEAYPGYGFGARKQLPQGVEKSGDIDWHKHYPDENDIVRHQKKLIGIMGTHFGLRGRGEHADLRKCNVIMGKFEPSSRFKNHDFIGLTGLLDKTTKVSATNDYARKSNNNMRLPIIDPEDPRDPGAIFKRYVDKMHPHQDRVYCRPATSKQLRIFKMQGNNNAAMSPHQPYGVNKIAKLLKEIGEETGIDCRGHGLRRLFLTTLVNDPAVSVEESLAAGRHGSVAAQRTYMQRNHTSEANRFAALGIKKKDDDSK